MKINEEFEIETDRASGYVLTRKIGQYTTKPKDGGKGEVKFKTEEFYLPSIGLCLQRIVDLSAQKIDSVEILLEKINQIDMSAVQLLVSLEKKMLLNKKIVSMTTELDKEKIRLLKNAGFTQLIRKQ